MRGVLRVQYYTFLIVLFNFLCIFNEGPYFPIVMNPRPPPPPPWKSFWCLFWATDCCAYPLVSHSYSVFRRGHPQPQKKTVSSPLHAKKAVCWKAFIFISALALRPRSTSCWWRWSCWRWRSRGSTTSSWRGTTRTSGPRSWWRTQSTSSSGDTGESYVDSCVFGVFVPYTIFE